MRNEFLKGLAALPLGAAAIFGLSMIAPATAQIELPEGPGKEQVFKACSGCHGLPQVVSEHKNSQEWAGVVTTMINNGAEVSDADFDVIVTYLATHFGDGSAAAPAGAAAPVAPAGAAAPVAPAAPPGDTRPTAGGTAPVPPAPAQ